MSTAFRSQRLIGLIAILFAVSGCGSAPLPPPPSSVDPAPVASPMVAPPTTAPIASKPKPPARQPESAAKVDTEPRPAVPPVAGQPAEAPQPKRPDVIGQRVDGPAAAGNFITALTRDLNGNIWVGTEDKGVLRGTPNGEWTQFTTKDGLGDDNAYAVCCDRRGRIWAAQQRHGVSVFNGEAWQTYGVLTGPLGERAFDIACCPLTGDIWIATSAGLVRYFERPLFDDAESEHFIGEWEYVTRADGLPSDQVQALAIATDGTVYAGTQCEGLAIGLRTSSGVEWRTVRGQLSMEEFRQSRGSGLPSNQINDVLVTDNGTVYVATTMGLAISNDKARSWKYLRGRDYADKVRQCRLPPPKTWNPVTGKLADDLLPEDYVTCLAEDTTARVWIGFRRQGFLVVEDKGGNKRHIPPGKEWSRDFITALVFGPDGTPWCASYGKGLAAVPEILISRGSSPGAKSQAQSGFPRHPDPVQPPTKELLLRLSQQMDDGKEPPTGPWGMYLGEDWTTIGDWVGRYGRQYALLCAAMAPFDSVYNDSPEWDVEAGMGPHHTEKDGLRRWIHWLKTDERRSLFDIKLGHRTQAECDDHGEAYPWTFDGPDLLFRVKVPEGPHRLSLYFFNKDGHDGNNRFRDYQLVLHPGAKTVEDSLKRPALARARIRDFWGGVYKQFLVRGPGEYVVEVQRNYSFNTICSAVLIDKLDEPICAPRGRASRAEQLRSYSIPWMGNIYYGPDWPELKRQPDEAAMNFALTEAAWSVWQKAEQQRNTFHITGRERLAFLTSYRAVRQVQPFSSLQPYMRWRLPVWTDRDRGEFDTAVRQAGAKVHLIEIPARPTK